MRHFALISCASCALTHFAAGALSPALAGTINFTGSITATAQPSGPCPVGTGGTVRFGDGVGESVADGTSNLGAFEPLQGHCIGAPVNGVRPLFNGDFEWTFADGAILAGTYAGSIFPTADPLVFNPIVTFDITSGIGRFLNASGQLQGDVFVFQAVRPFQTEWEISGPLDLPAIPEPATWAMMILGLGAAGAALRRRRTLQRVLQ